MKKWLFFSVVIATIGAMTASYLMYKSDEGKVNTYLKRLNDDGFRNGC